jgi:hypothetical protein
MIAKKTIQFVFPSPIRSTLMLVCLYGHLRYPSSTLSCEAGSTHIFISLPLWWMNIMIPSSFVTVFP